MIPSAAGTGANSLFDTILVYVLFQCTSPGSTYLHTLDRNRGVKIPHHFRLLHNPQGALTSTQWSGIGVQNSTPISSYERMFIFTYIGMYVCKCSNVLVCKRVLQLVFLNAMISLSDLPQAQRTASMVASGSSLARAFRFPALFAHVACEL